MPMRIVDEPDAAGVWACASFTTTAKRTRTSDPKMRRVRMALLPRSDRRWGRVKYQKRPAVQRSLREAAVRDDDIGPRRTGYMSDGSSAPNRPRNLSAGYFSA